MTVSRFCKSAWIVPALVTVFVPTVHAAGENEPGLTVSGEIKLEYFDKRITGRNGEIEKDSGSMIDEAVLTFDATFGAWPRATLALATEKVGTPEFEPVFVKEFILSHRFGPDHEGIAGRMKLPFGNFRTATVTDPQTKKIGQSKTDAGLGVKGKNDAAGLTWNVVAFTDDYRTLGPGADGVTANLAWKAAANWSLGGGAISHQYARTDLPPLANVHFGVHEGPWRLMGEYVAALNDKGAERPRAASVDGIYQAAPQFKIGIRRQAAERRSAVNGVSSRYDEWALALKYEPYPHATMGIEYLTGKRRGEPEDFQDVRQITAQVVLSF